MRNPVWATHRPTIRDVATSAGVSVATVSHVVNRTQRVSREVRAKVQEAITALGYHPNAVARSLRRQRTQTLGLIISNIVNPFFPSVVRGVEDAAREKGYNVVLCNTDEDPVRERVYAEVLAARQVDGCVVVPSPGAAESLAFLQSRGIPTVLVDREVPGVSAPVVLVDNRRGAYQATEYLIGLGHQRIGVVTGPLTLTTGTERLQGYLEALKAHGISVSEALVREADFRLEGGREAAVSLLGENPRPTALFVTNNLMALGALQAAATKGVRIPHELSVVVFDDMPWCAFVAPPLTTVSQPMYALGVEAVRLLIGRRGPVKRPRSRVVRLGVELVIRASSTSPGETSDPGR